MSLVMLLVFDKCYWQSPQIQQDASWSNLFPQYQQPDPKHCHHPELPTKCVTTDQNIGYLCVWQLNLCNRINDCNSTIPSSWGLTFHQLPMTMLQPTITISSVLLLLIPSVSAFPHLALWLAPRATPSHHIPRAAFQLHWVHKWWLDPKVMI